MVYTSNVLGLGIAQQINKTKCDPEMLKDYEQLGKVTV